MRLHPLKLSMSMLLLRSHLHLGRSARVSLSSTLVTRLSFLLFRRGTRDVSREFACGSIDPWKAAVGEPWNGLEQNMRKAMMRLMVVVMRLMMVVVVMMRTWMLILRMRRWEEGEEETTDAEMEDSQENEENAVPVHKTSDKKCNIAKMSR
jgi:hypothetical protein